jgi:hypothetical protein
MESLLTKNLLTKSLLPDFQPREVVIVNWTLEQILERWSICSEDPETVVDTIVYSTMVQSFRGTFD